MGKTLYGVGIIGAIAVLGCGDEASRETATSSSTTSGTTTGSGGDGGAGVGGAGGGGVGGGTLKARVVVLDEQSMEQPATGAAVAVDAGGKRIEKLVDAEGRATFDGVDFSGDVLAIGARAGYGFAATSGIKEDAGEVLLSLPTTPSADVVTLSGTAANMLADSDNLTVTASVAGATAHQAQGTAYSIEVPKGAPFSILALDWELGTDPVSAKGVSQTFHAWTSAMSPGLTASGTLDVDFATKLTPKTVTGSFPIVTPSDNALAKTGYGYVIVYGAGPTSPFLGASTKIDISADAKTFEYQAEYVELPGTTPITFYSQQTQTTYSGAAVEGNPTDGAQAIILPAPPKKTSSNAPALGETMTWDLPYTDDSAQVILRVYGANGSYSYVLYPPGSTQGSIPKLPTLVDPATVFGTSGNATGAIGICGGIIAKKYCGISAQSAMFPVGL